MSTEEVHSGFGGDAGSCGAFLEDHGGGLAGEGFGCGEGVDGGLFAVGVFVVFG